MNAFTASLKAPCISSFYWALSTPAVSTEVSWVGVKLFPSFNIFYHFTFPGSPFTL